MNKNKTVQPLSENTRKAIIIAAIVAVAVIILSISLALILKPTALSPDDESSSSSGSSSLSIRNGDFEYTTSENTAFPKTAQNWTRYGYKKAEGTLHEFESITSNDKAVMGIVNVSEDEDDDVTWAKNVLPDLEAEGLDVKNPGLHKDIEEGDDANKNVYMIATKEPTAASILSDSVSVSSGASVKITIRLNTRQITSGSAVVMIQKSTVSALSKNWYSYTFDVNDDDFKVDDNGWQTLVFHIFNRDASTKYIRVSIGIGNVYSGEEDLKLADAATPIQGEGVLFIDDITYETVTANDYREVVDADLEAKSTMYKIIENEDIVDESVYLGLDTENTEVTDNGPTTLKTFTEASGSDSAFDKDSTFSPFTNRDDFYKDNKGGQHSDPTGFTVYKLSHDGSKNLGTPLALRLNASALNSDGDKNINVKSSLILKDHHHISFWVRVNQRNKVAYANVYVQKKASDGSWKDLSTSSSWTLVTTSQDIEEDANCGWVKYDIYLKPSTADEEISILFVLGKNDDYTSDEQKLGLIPNGDMYVTSPAYEKISYSDYNTASSGSNVKKLDLVGTSDSTAITNGSFSTLDSTGRQPSGWTPAFGGDNSIFRDGKADHFKDEERLAEFVKDSGTVQNFGEYIKHNDGTRLDDAQKNVLRINNEAATSFGYYSSDFTLSARTAYVISVMFKPGENNANAHPYVYLLDTDASAYTDNDKATAREQRILASVTDNKQFDSEIEASIFGFDYNNGEFGNGWARYCMIVVTGDDSIGVRLALFNGSIDGEVKEQGTVYYDKVEMHTLGNYSFVEAEDDDINDDNAEYYETHYKVKWSNHPYITATTETKNLYGENFNELLTKESSEEGKTLLEAWGIDVNTLGLEDLEERSIIPEEEETDDGDTDTGTTTEPSKVDLGLLFSVISSVALVAALLVVFVVKLYRNKSRHPKAA